MTLIEIIWIILLTASWFTIFDLPFVFSGSYHCGAIRKKGLLPSILITLTAGFLLASESSWQHHEQQWNIPHVLVAMIIALATSIGLLLMKKNGPEYTVSYALAGPSGGWQIYQTENFPVNEVI